MNNESSAYILQVAAFEKMNIRREKLRPIYTPLIGFSRECLIPLGSINLPTTIKKTTLSSY